MCMGSLKRSLTDYGVDYTERVFTSRAGIAGLGQEPVVSIFLKIRYGGEFYDY